MDIILRRARSGDEAKLSLLGGATFLTAFAHDHPGDGLVRHVERKHAPAYYAAALADPAKALWLAETPLGAPIGYAVMAPPDLPIETGPADLELLRIYALTGFQGAGLGRRLLDAVMAEARARGGERLLLCVYTANHGAQRFYASHGFAFTGAIQQFDVGGTAFEDQIWSRLLV